MSRMIIFAVIFFYTICLGCKTDGEHSDQLGLDEGTIQMVKLLQEVHAKIDPMKVNYHLNSVRADKFKIKLQKSTDLIEQLQTRAQYSNELLLAGKTLQAIMEIEELKIDLEKINPNPEFMYKLEGLLALSYMRMGEEDNCLGKNNSESCILPIRGDGIYKMGTGSETAISIYESMLQNNPNDPETIWLLNIAYMTLGRYPDDVPSQWLIPETVFESAGKVSPFKNISNKLKLGTVALAGGSCVEDFNNDGYLDIMASSWGVNDQIMLFYNQGDGTFKDVSHLTELKGITGGLNMIHADYNNDGFADVLILRGGWYTSEGNIPNSLLRNNGNGTFTDVTIETGLLSQFPTQTATWNDFNNDGWVDLFIGNESSRNLDFPNELYINEHGHFTNLTQEAGLSHIRGIVKGVCSGDVNNDGWADIYLSIMGGYNILMMNEGIEVNKNCPKFKDVSIEAGVQNPIGSFPTWMFDYNNDGMLDIFAGSYNLANPEVAKEMADYFINNHNKNNPSKLHLYKNLDGLTFNEVSEELKLVEPAFAMGANFGDIDNDGFLDFYLGTGAPGFGAIVPNKMYRNNKGQKFEDVTSISRLGHVQKGHGVSFGDFDNDGDQDIFHVLGGAFEGDVYSDAFFENTSDGSNNWITLILEGINSNRSAIGAQIKLVCYDENNNESTYYHTVSSGGSFGSSSLQQEIGLGKSNSIGRIEIKWPNLLSSIDTFYNIDINRFVKIIEGNRNIAYLERNKFTFQE